MEGPWLSTWARGLVEGRVLLDTGSAVTILRAEVWNELKLSDIRELQVVSKNVVTADSSSLEMLGAGHPFSGNRWVGSVIP